MASVFIKSVRLSCAKMMIGQVIVRGLCSSWSLVAAKAPLKVELKADKWYSWCSCGRSERQPFCDGSHKGSGMRPHRFRQDKYMAEALLCCCKKTSTPPFCDGTHTTEKIQSAEIGNPIVSH